MTRARAPYSMTTGVPGWMTYWPAWAIETSSPERRRMV
jgi:hypothetical protein